MRPCAVCCRAHSLLAAVHAAGRSCLAGGAAAMPGWTGSSFASGQRSARQWALGAGLLTSLVVGALGQQPEGECDQASNTCTCAPGRYSTIFDCYDTVTVHIYITEYGDEISWTMDGGEPVHHTSEHNGDSHFAQAQLDPSGTHTFTWADSYGDGWHGGYWELLSPCNVTIAGGERAGQVAGYGGSVSFDGAQHQCCSCSGTVGCDPALLPVPVSQTPTTCTSCPAGRFSAEPGAQDECPGVCSAGQSAAPGSASCTVCPAGTLDHDSDPATPCENCPVGTWSSDEGSVAVECTTCPDDRQISPVGSASVDMCAESFDQGHGLPPCGEGLRQAAIRCFEYVTVRAYIQTAYMVRWFIDDGAPQTYANIQNDFEERRVDLSFVEDHVFIFEDTSPTDPNGVAVFRGWGPRAYWEILDGCGNTIAGGPSAGSVQEAGGSVRFAGGSQCCEVDADATDPPTGGFETTTCSCLQGTELIAGSCRPCPAGRADTDANAYTVCVDCPAGTFSDAVGVTECSGGACPNGTYAPAGSGSCSTCAAGTVDLDSDPVTPCVSCENGQYSEAEGSTFPCSECDAGKYAARGSAECTSCYAENGSCEARTRCGDGGADLTKCDPVVLFPLPSNTPPVGVRVDNMYED
eukprot:COSAG02_NODE_7346_length_3053_cov_7.426713_4_plen_634_part_01